MKNKKSNFLKLLPMVFKQGIKDGKTGFVLLHLLGIIVSASWYFSLRVPEITTNIAYKFITKENLDFVETIKPLFILINILLSFHFVSIIKRLLSIYVTRNIKTNYELGLARKLSKMTWESYETHEVNLKIEMVKRDGVNSYMAISLDLITWLINTVCAFIIYVLVVIRISWLIGFLFLLASIIYIIIGVYCGNIVYKTHRNNDGIYKRRSYLYGCSKSKEAHQDGIVNRLYHHLSKRWRKMNDDWMNDTIKAQSKIEIYNLIPSFIFALIAGSLLFIVVKEIQAGRQEIGYFTLIITTIINFRGTLYSLSTNIQWYQKYFNVFQDYLTLMKVEEELPNTNKLLRNNFEITFNNVSYVYPQSEHKALNHLNIDINSHETIAIVGVNGSGKTTFVNILMELSKKYQGDIFVNDQNINDTIGILRNSCSCIFQDFLEYQFSIKENIALGDLSRDLTDEEVWRILNDVGLAESVKKLPDGIHSMLGQINKGTELSKGQWQRLAVARLLANKNSKIWILDEPTAYLDPIGEIEMYNFIYKLKGNRTVIFISHRLGFAKKANRIIVFKDGSVIEDGTHSELMKDSTSEYAIMYDKQKKWYE
ncbi:ABC transporter ATP-binding protein [Mycoplasmatota bacterium]|nr:ABC transporter ATP-binding protein [Mycoplasmatota bacterium]